MVEKLQEGNYTKNKWLWKAKDILVESKIDDYLILVIRGLNDDYRFFIVKEKHIVGCVGDEKRTPWILDILESSFDKDIKLLLCKICYSLMNKVLSARAGYDGYVINSECLEKIVQKENGDYELYFTF